MNSTTKSYDIALSFSGSDREFVERVAKDSEQLGISVFYDRFEEVDLWGKDLYDYLSDIYQNRATYTVVFVSNAYASSVWPTHERRNAQARALAESVEYILPVRFDDTDVPGLPGTIGYIDARVKTPLEIAQLIKSKIDSDGRPVGPHFDLRPMQFFEHLRREPPFAENAAPAI